MEAEAKQRQKRKPKEVCGGNVATTDSETNGKTRDILAAKVGVGAKAIDKAKKIAGRTPVAYIISANLTPQASDNRTTGDGCGEAGDDEGR